MCDLKNPIFTNENKARMHLESILWPGGPVCPKCGSYDGIAKVRRRKKGTKTRPGLYYCNACKAQFTVTVGSIFERSKIPLTKWLLGFHLMASSKKGMSAHQLHRSLGVTYKTAWFMAHRIREAMRDDSPFPMGGGGQIVEADETYIGKTKRSRHTWTFVNNKGWVKRGGSGTAHSNKIISLVERGGRARSIHVPALTANAAKNVLRRNVLRKDTHLITDESNIYKGVGKEYASHETVNHSVYEWGRGMVHTNTIEGFFSIFKRGMRGVYQHCGEQHLHRYLAEFDFRYSNRKVTDRERTLLAVKGATGKRLTYVQSRKSPHA